MQVKRVDVIVGRSVFESIPKTVFHHEVPLLEEKFEEVFPAKDGHPCDHWMEGKQYPWEDMDRDMDAEYQRLSRCYGVGKDDGKQVVEAVYGHPRNMAIERFYDSIRKEEAEYEPDSMDDMPDMPEMSGMMVMDPSMMTAQAIKKVLTQNGVSYDISEGKKSLEQKLKDFLKGGSRATADVPPQSEAEMAAFDSEDEGDGEDIE